MNANLHNLPTLATKSIPIIPPRLRSLREWREIQLPTAASDMRQAPAGNARNYGGAGEVAIEIIGRSAKDWELTK